MDRAGTDPPVLSQVGFSGTGASASRDRLQTRRAATLVTVRCKTHLSPYEERCGRYNISAFRRFPYLESAAAAPVGVLGRNVKAASDGERLRCDRWRTFWGCANPDLHRPPGMQRGSRRQVRFVNEKGTLTETHPRDAAVVWAIWRSALEGHLLVGVGRIWTVPTSPRFRLGERADHGRSRTGRGRYSTRAGRWVRRCIFRQGGGGFER